MLEINNTGKQKLNLKKLNELTDSSPFDRSHNWAGDSTFFR